ncbi:hypothetical protein E2C01_090358 [Portunus trituberculatus]|uniref:Uncharacterized protein n=1 Tax=Portunus trituberculatus TaxID=210409 RepID=A0A5B7JB80_PORTR|nr:hypothetical protein [Portunus trituberculatus]
MDATQSTQGKALREPSKAMLAHEKLFQHVRQQQVTADGIQRHPVADSGTGGFAQWHTTDSSARWCWHWHEERDTGDLVKMCSLTHPGNLPRRTVAQPQAS